VHALHVVQHPLPRHEAEATYTWKIANVTKNLAQVMSDNDYGEIESEPFFSSHGYKMTLGIDLNESSYAGYMGVYLYNDEK
jgi:hypothetical protein